MSKQDRRDGQRDGSKGRIDGKKVDTARDYAGAAALRSNRELTGYVPGDLSAVTA